MTWPILTALAVVWVSIAAAVILLQRRSAAATIAWLFALVFLPGIGLVVYRLLGPLRLKRKQLRRRVNRRLIDDALSALQTIGDAGRDELQIARLPIALREAPPLHADAV